MKLRFMLTGVLVVCFAFSAISGVAAKPASDAAFLTDHATSVSEVVKQVEGNRLLALRYAKHFRTDPSSVVTFLRNELSVSTFAEDTTMAMYHLDTSRNIATKSMQYKRGARVFANRAGSPILEFGTGNPLTTDLTTGGLRDLAVPAAGAAGPGAVVTQVLDQPPMELSPTAPVEAASAVPPMAETDELGDGTLIAVNVPGAGGVSSVGGAAPAISSGSSATSWLLPAGLLGAAAVFAGTGGSNGSTPLPPYIDPGDNDYYTPPPVVDPTPPPIEDVIPEPASMIVLGSGAAGLFGFLYRKRRS